MSGRYILKRLFRALISLLIIVTIVFLIMRLMPIEGYFDSNYDLLTEQQVQNTLNKLGLNQPISTQLFQFYSRLLQGDLGISNRYRVDVPVIKLLADKMPISFLLGILAVLIGIPGGMLLGIVMARYHRKWPDKLGTLYMILLQMVPSVILYILIQSFGSKWLGTSMLYRTGDWTSLILPVFSLSIFSIAHYALWTRRLMLDSYQEDFVQTARSKGAGEMRIAIVHVFRKAALPLIQQLPTVLIMTLCGSLYVESLYSIPGMGSLLVDAISMQDNGLTQGLVLVYASFGVFSMLAGDLLIAALDPRIRYENRSKS